MKLSIIACLFIVLSGFVRAADNADPGTPTSGASGAPTEQSKESIQIGKPAQVDGKIISLHTLKLAGFADDHVLAKLENADGEVTIVDLGSAADLKKNGVVPHENLSLFVDGRMGKINDKPLVVAEKLSESRIVTVAPRGHLREETEKHAMNRQETDTSEGKAETAEAEPDFRTLEGTVVHSRNVAIKGEKEEHVLAKVKTSTGALVVIDLGARSTLPNIDLKEGAPIAATGIVGRLNGKPILLADSVGNLANIQRPEENKGVPTSSKAPEKAPIK